MIHSVEEMDPVDFFYLFIFLAKSLFTGFLYFLLPSKQDIKLS